MYPMFVFCFYRLYKLVCSCPSAAVVPHENGGVQRGVTPLAHWGVFSISAAVREENALMSYGFSVPQNPLRCR
ncbi:hypothetical protein M135_0020 [Bacteroides fragilis str. S36L5]|uniref:Secreted protein n=1 Tax=Bacteroides fragilis str. S36L11 TaxID=1339327 RepID=A0A015WWA9_BACFG|nr:hypothetical protein M136_4644 [Bacteroides fragilis str. S36L11]EYA93316.1 hypothetical protein M135_0020 [Bacteroides fragilis str. S36L5]